jgi:hypothetical protein
MDAPKATAETVQGLGGVAGGIEKYLNSPINPTDAPIGASYGFDNPASLSTGAGLAGLGLSTAGALTGNEALSHFGGTLGTLASTANLASAAGTTAAGTAGAGTLAANTLSGLLGSAGAIAAPIMMVGGGNIMNAIMGTHDPFARFVSFLEGATGFGNERSVDILGDLVGMYNQYPEYNDAIRWAYDEHLNRIREQGGVMRQAGQNDEYNAPALQALRPGSEEDYLRARMGYIASNPSGMTIEGATPLMYDPSGFSQYYADSTPGFYNGQAPIYRMSRLPWE